MLIKKMQISVVLVALFLLVACGPEANEENATVAEAVVVDQNLSGKTVTILVGFNPGGGTDTSARLINKYLSKHIAGSPNVIVKNMTGAAGIRALNYTFEKARPDGQTLIFAPISLLVPMLGEPGIRYQLDKFEVVGGLQSGPLVQLLRQDSVAGKAPEATNIMSAADLRLGGIRTSSSLDLMARLALDQLELPFKYVTGYSNENSVRNALQGSEVNTFLSTFAGFRSAALPTLVETEIAFPLWQFPYRDDDGNYPRGSFAPDLPTFMEVYESITGNAPEGETWEALKLALDLRSVADNMLLAPPGTDPVVLKALRDGFSAAVADPDMITEVQGVLGYFYTVVPTASIESRFTAVSDVNPVALEFLKNYIANAE